MNKAAGFYSVPQLDPAVERQYQVMAVKAAGSILDAAGVSSDVSVLAKVSRAIQCDLRDLALHQSDLKARAMQLDPPMALHLNYTVEDEQLVRKFALTEVDAMPLEKGYSGVYSYQGTSGSTAKTVAFASIYEVEDFVQRKENWQQAGAGRVAIAKASPAALERMEKADSTAPSVEGMQAVATSIDKLASAIADRPVPVVNVNVPGSGATKEMIERDSSGNIVSVTKRPIA